MKVLTQQQIDEHQSVVYRGMAEGAVVGGAIAGAGATYLYKTSNAFRILPRSMKALGTILILVPAMTIQGERRGVQYDQSQW